MPCASEQTGRARCRQCNHLFASLFISCNVALLKDDDANSAVGHAPQPQAQTKPQAKPEISSERLAKAIEAIKAGKATKTALLTILR